jgi:4,5-DOPA dioxygenase extradiol
MQTTRLPVLFFAHGSPMNAVEDNSFTRTLKTLGPTLPRPKAVCCVSAHWYGKGTFVCSSEKPETIHDFGGFPRELFQIQYPAPGHPALARRTAELLHCSVSTNWGLDHGAWSVLLRLFPDADIPIFQVSLNAALSATDHYALGKRLAPLREEGVLLLGSGNVVHNLAEIDWNEDAEPFDWALEFDRSLKNHLLSRNDQALVQYEKLPQNSLAVPTPDHYLPFLWMLGAAQGTRASFPYEGFQNASMSMRCVRFD